MVAQTHCKGCNVTITGSTAVTQLESHRGLCKQCRGHPIGYEGERRKHEICADCGKEFGQH